MYPFEELFLYYLCKYLVVKLLDRKVVLFPVLFFFFFTNLHDVFQSGCTSLHSYPQCKRVPLSPHPWQHLLFHHSLILVILTDVMCYLTVLLNCIFLKISIVEHLFMCLLAMFMSPWENVHSCHLPIFNWISHFLGAV